MTGAPSFLDLQAAMMRATLSGLHTCMPGEVIRVHGAATPHRGQFIDVQPSLRRQVYDATDELIDEALPVIPMVPVAHLQGGGFYVAVPLQVGDFVTLVFAERSLDRWLEVARKGAGATVTPGDVGMHPLDGAIALPTGPAPRTALLPGVSDTELVIGGPAGVMLRLRPDGSIALAEGSGGPVAMAQLVAAELNRVKADLLALKSATLTAITAVNGGLTTPVQATVTAFTTSTAALPSAPASVASTRVTAL